MSLIRLEPFASLQGDFDRLVDSFWGNQNASRDRQPSAWTPAMDVRETENDYVLTFDVPGLKADDISVELDGGRLTVSGERTRENVAEGERVHRFERQFGAFARSISLPQGVDEDKIEAEHRDGVLVVKVAKPEVAKPKRIQIGEGHPEIEGDVAAEDREPVGASQS